MITPSLRAMRMPDSGYVSSSYSPWFQFGSSRIASRCSERIAIENGNARALPEMLMCERAEPGCSSR